MTATPAFLSDTLRRYRHFDLYEDAVADLEARLPDPGAGWVLDAGCGSRSWLRQEGARVVGLDASREQLDRHPSLLERHCADLHEYAPAEWVGRFSRVVCWDVLEHLHSPEAVIEKMVTWLHPDGRLVLAFPNPQTLKGFVTRHTPHFVHQIFYKLASGTPFSATRAAEGPFRTVISPSLRFMDVLSLLERNGCRVDRLYSIESYQNRYVKRFVPAVVVDRLDRFFLGGLHPMLHNNATDFIFVVSVGSPDGGER